MKALYLILGHPVHHSRSPAMHNAAFRALGIDATYAPCAVHPSDLEAAIQGIRALGVAGANVTLPHKTAVLAYLDDITPAAKAIGAVNTLYWDGPKLSGDNTDALGLADSLTSAGVPLAGSRVTLLGAGGAARAAIVGLASRGASHITIVARRPTASAALREAMGAALPQVPGAGGCTLESREWDSLAELMDGTDLLIQGTSATLAGQPDAATFAASIPIARLPAHAYVTDLVYMPRQTTVLQKARERGLVTVNGLGMLLHQGALAFERWTGQAAPRGVMQAVLTQDEN